MQILVPSDGPASWQKLLASPNKQWRDGYSAKELAQSWESAQHFPPEVAVLFRSCGSLVLRHAEPLLAIPEHKVPLTGGLAASQTDLFVLASGNGRLMTIMVEGKAAEGFAERLDDWLKNASPGKRERLSYLKSVLGLSGTLPDNIRYQLLHRTASAVIEAERFAASFAVLLVHSFSDNPASLQDFNNYLGLFNAHYEPDQLVRLGSPGGIELYAGWATRP